MRSCLDCLEVINSPTLFSCSESHLGGALLFEPIAAACVCLHAWFLWTKKSGGTGSGRLEEVNQCRQKKPLMVLPGFSSAPVRPETIAQLSTVLATPQGSPGTSIMHTACQCLLYSTLPQPGWTPTVPLLGRIPSWHFSDKMLSRDSINWDGSICASRGCWSLLYLCVWALLWRGTVFWKMQNISLYHSDIKMTAHAPSYLLVVSGHVSHKCWTVVHG